MVLVLSTTPFARFMKREGLDDGGVLEAIERAERGIIDADLGGGLVKQRIARFVFSGKPCCPCRCRKCWS
jgi:hypothetical protein